MTSLLAIFFVLLFVVIIVALLRNSAMYQPFDDYEDEVTTTTTTTTTTFVDTPAVAAVAPTATGLNINGIPIVGMLQRQFEGTQPFVMDPVDKDKVWLNTTDDIYEDGAGKMWGLQ